MEELIKADICKHGNIHEWCDITGPCGDSWRERVVAKENRASLDKTNNLNKDD